MARSALSEIQTRSRKITHCIHCGTMAPSPFCCNGCEAAYYAAEHIDSDTLSTTPPKVNEKISGFSPFAKSNEDGSYTLVLSVSGMHCASCMQSIERVLYADPSVQSARVNLSTERLTLTWQGEQAYGDKLVSHVVGLGYRLKPFDPDMMQQDTDRQQIELIRCLAVAGFAAGNIMLISVALWSTTQETMGVATRDLFHWISALIALPTILYAGRPFFSSALAALKQRHANMDVPISLAVLLASSVSLFETFTHGEHVYFDSSVMLLFFLLIGRYLDVRAKGKARASATKLLSMMGGTATVLEGGKPRMVPIRELQVAMHVLVAVGERIPADGVVTKGQSELDMSLITGETVPEAVGEEQTVFAGTVNLSAPLHITVSKSSEECLLHNIVTLMEQAEQGKSRYVRLADKASRYYTPLVHSLGAITFIGWWWIMQAPWQVSLLHAVTVLIITCPCALGLAVPVAQVLASGQLMKRGILLKSGDALERLASIDTVAVDKTGTLTLGRPELLEEGHTYEALQLAASLAIHSKHPLSLAIGRAYQGEPIPLEVEEIPGKGLQSVYQGKRIRLGKPGWCGYKEAGIDHTALALCLSVEGGIPQIFSFKDQLREDAAAVIGSLQQEGLHTTLLSGDREGTVSDMANRVGISNYQAALSPLEKCEHLQALTDAGYNVVMVGDGLNDAPSLAAATVSISPATAIDITQNAADIVFQGEKLSPVLEVWYMACATQRIVKQNFVLAFLYNAVAVPLAVMGYVTPLIAAAAMSGSSLVVILNAFRLTLNKRKKT